MGYCGRDQSCRARKHVATHRNAVQFAPSIVENIAMLRQTGHDGVDGRRIQMAMLELDDQWPFDHQIEREENLSFMTFGIDLENFEALESMLRDENRRVERRKPKSVPDHGLRVSTGPRLFGD